MIDEERSAIRRRYSFAVPSHDALDTIVRHSSAGVVEIGAGGGYWASLLRQRGVNVIAYDPKPPGTDVSQWHTGPAWTTVQQGDHTKAADHPTRTLFLCWPNQDEPWAAQALECYAGDVVIYIGEGPGGHCADDRFHALLGEGNDLPYKHNFPVEVDALFAPVAEVAIPTWAGMHDRLKVYRRKVPFGSLPCS